MDSHAFALLRCDSITKKYAVNVLDRVSLELRAGEIHGLLGANGAGKSTLCKIIAGLTQPTSGAMQLAGHVYAPANKQAAEVDGVQIVQQELNQVGTLTVAENVLIGRWPSRMGVVRRGELHRRAKAALSRMGLHDLPLDIPVSRLGIGVQQMLEIATALDRHCRVLIMDEPTASLTSREAEHLFEQLAGLRADGVGIIYISHRLDEVAALTDRITILRDGQNVITCDTPSMSTREMVRHMSGEESSVTNKAFQSFATDRVVLKVNGLSRPPTFENVSFSLFAGERLGIAGLVGSGRTELLRSIFGADSVTAGSLELQGEYRAWRHPKQAVRAGMAMVTEDRKATGLLLAQSIAYNASLSSLDRFRSWMGRIKQSEIEAATASCVQAMSIRCEHLRQTVGSLSGGNQQKVVLSKWLIRQSNVLLLDEPTRGVDVAAREQIYQQLEGLARAGKSILLVSSDMQELMTTCDRVLTLSAGRLTGEFFRRDWSLERINQACFVGYTQQET